MEYLIATVVIMLFCITALIQDKSPESMPESRHKAKSLKPGKSHEKSVTKFTGVHQVIPASSLPKLSDSNVIEIRFKHTLLPKLPGTGRYSIIPVMANSQGYFYQAPVLVLTKQIYYLSIISVLFGFNENLLSYQWKPDVKCNKSTLSKNK